jgi:hypothetical protein
MTTSEPIQQPLSLEHPVPDHYDIELRKGPSGEQTLRAHEASNSADALAFVEALRDDAVARYMVTWKTEEPTDGGKMFGLAPAGVQYEIAVIPPLEDLV